MAKFDPRAIPGRDHYDRLSTWAVMVLATMTAEDLAYLQSLLRENARAAVKGINTAATLKAVLAELGFCAVLDSMADIIELDKS